MTVPWPSGLRRYSDIRLLMNRGFESHHCTTRFGSSATWHYFKYPWVVLTRHVSVRLVSFVQYSSVLLSSHRARCALWAQAPPHVSVCGEEATTWYCWTSAGWARFNARNYSGISALHIGWTSFGHGWQSGNCQLQCPGDFSSSLNFVSNPVRVDWRINSGPVILTGMCMLARQASSPLPS